MKQGEIDAVLAALDTSEISVSEKFMCGDIIKATLKHVKTMEKPYGALSEYEQNSLIAQIVYDVREAVRQGALIIAAADRPTVQAEVESVTFKDGIKAVLKVSKLSEERHDLADATGCRVLIVIPNAEQHLGGEVTADKKQKTLPGVEVDPRQLSIEGTGPVQEPPEAAPTGAEPATV